MAPSQEFRGSVSIPDWKGSVVCPRPRRVGLLINDPLWPLRHHMGHQAEVIDSKAGAELLDIFLMKEGIGSEQSGTQFASSPPFFSGSPPCRTANPVIEDSRFVGEKLTSSSASPVPSPSASLSPSPSSARKGGCVGVKFGHKPAAVRVEGFECLNSDRQRSRVPTVAY